MNHQRTLNIIIATFALLAASMSASRDNAHRYNVAHFSGEPRFERDWLTSVYCAVNGGFAEESRNRFGKKETTLLNLYGFENLQRLADNAQLIDVNNPLDVILIDVNNLPERRCFGKVKYFGQFSLAEIILNLHQNLKGGFFFEAHAPIRHLSVERIGFNDQTPNDGITPHKRTPEWSRLLSTLDAILQRYGLSTRNTKKTGFGDTTLSIGWTKNYQKTIELDYIDATLRAGILFPTGKEKKENLVFDLPTGYNGHYGFPLSFDLSLGIFEWLTFGLNSGILIFKNKNKQVRMKTSPRQNGFIKLTKGNALVKPGTLWHLGFFVKLDHVRDVFSWTTAYSYHQQNNTTYVPRDKLNFNFGVVNDDKMLRSWGMHVLNIIWELDFATERKPSIPNVRFMLNVPLAGHQIFTSMTGGGAVELNLMWNY